MKIYMVRHGETDWNKQKRVQGHADIPLNAYGRLLAEKTAEGMKEIVFDAAYTSPLARAKETAQIILDGRNIPLVETEEIREIGFGSYEGIVCRGEKRDPRSVEFVKFFDDPAQYVPPKDGESIEELMQREAEFLNRLCAEYKGTDKQILISTHGAAVTAMKNWIKGNCEKADFWSRGVPKNCAVTIAEEKEGVFEILEEDRLYYEDK